MRLMSSLLLAGIVSAAVVAAPATAQQGGQGAGQGAAQRRNATPLGRLGWRLSCQAWTFRDLTLFETIELLPKLGIRNIEMFPGQKLSKEKPEGFSHDSPDAVVQEVIAKLRENRVRAVAYGVVGLGEDEKSARKVFEFAKKLNMRTITSEPSEASMPMLDKLTKEFNIGVAIHNHPQPSHYWSPDTVLKAVAGTGKLIGSCADTGHWYRSGLVPLDCLKQLKGRIVSLHFKDLNKDKEDVPWGTGVCDVPAMLAELKAQKVRAVFSIEYERTTGAELIANVEKCVKFMEEQAKLLAPPAPAP